MKKKKYIETTVFSILNSRSKKTAVILLTLVLFGISIMLIPTMFVKGKLLPKPTADSFSIYVDLPEGKSVYETKEVSNCIVDQLKDQEIITDMSVFLGESGPVDFSAMLKGRVFASGENMATITVNLKKEELRDEDSILAVNRLRPVIQNTCSINGANIKMIEEPAGPPVLASLVLEITSNSRQDYMENVAEKIVDIFKQTETLVDIDTDSDSSYTQHGITLNYNKIAKSGLALPQVKKILYLAFEGMNIAYVDEANSNNQIPIHLVLSHKTKKLKDANSSTLENKLSAVQLMNVQGILIPLSELITITERTNEHKIMSKNLMPIVSVIAEADMESAIYPLLDARKSIMKVFSDDYTVDEVGILDLKLSHKKNGDTFYLHWDGEQKLTYETFRDLGLALGVAIMLIYFLMVIYYQSFSLAGSIVVASFISVSGVIYASFIINIFSENTFFLTGPSLIGFIALIGINSRNSLLIIDFAKQLIEDKNFSVERAIAISVQTRAKPILLTVLAIVFASLLLATDPVFSGLGVALIGGTLIAYVVSLYVVPVIINGALLRQYPKIDLVASGENR